MGPDEVGAAVPEETATSTITNTDQDAGRTHSTSADGPGEGGRDDIRSYLDAVFGDKTGLAVFAVGMNPYRDPRTGKYKHKFWNERNGEKIAFSWPQEAEQICEAIEQYGHLGDLHIVPYLRRSHARAKGDAVILQVVHTDCDKGLDQEKIAILAGLGAFVIGSGSPGNGHVYIPLDREVSQWEHEALCKGLIACLDGDRAKFNDNDLLRPVGGYNLKSTVFEKSPARRVHWLVKPNGKKLDPRTLADLLGVDLDAVKRAKTNGHAKGNGKGKHYGGNNWASKPREEGDLTQHPRVKGAIDQVTGDRSEDIARIVGACVDSGLTIAHAYWCCAQRDDLIEKLNELSHDDVARLWEKVSTDRGRRGQPQRLEDAFIGAHIADDYLKGTFLHSTGFGWMHFDGRRWEAVPESIVGEVVRLGVIEFQRQEALAGADDERRKRIAALLSAAKLRAILWVARGYLSVQDKEFDTHADLLNVRNGVVNLRDGSLRPHDPDLLLTKLTMVDYRPDARHEDWGKALGALPADGADWLQLRLGQGLTGYPPADDVGVFLQGSGENGKTSIVDGVRAAAGDYAVPLPDRVLLSRTGDHPTELMTLRGARIAFMEELPELGHLNVKRWKDLHGTQEISARLCGRDTVTWKITHSTFVTTNYLPRVDESDHGTWRRLALLEFPYRYRKADEELVTANDRRGDPGLRQRLREGSDGQHEAVLAWLVEGATRWYRDGRIMPALPGSVAKSTARWRRSVDLLGRYLDENIAFDVEYHVMTKDLFADFTKWLKANGHLPWSEQNFAARLSQHEAVVAAGVEKKSKHRSPGSGLSRKPDFGFPQAAPKQYLAWFGMRFPVNGDYVDDPQFR